MVEINNQRKAFLDMLAWSEELITDARNQKSWLWRQAGELVYWLPRSPSQTCHAKPKPNQQAPDATSFFPVAGCLPQAAWSERLLSESQDAVALQQIKERGALPMIDRYPSGNRPLQQYLGLLPGAGYGQFEYVDSLIAKFKEAGGTVREIDEQSHRDYLRSVICIIVCLSWAVNHYRDNAITYKAQRDKKCQRTEAGGTRQLPTCRCVSVMLLRRCKIHEGVSWC